MEKLPPLSSEYIREFSGQTLVNASIAFLILETVAVALRFYSRTLKNPEIRLDDILIVPAYLTCAGLAGLGIGLVEYCGVGRHALALMETSPETLVAMGKAVLALAALYLPAAALPKLTLLAFYLHIFSTPVYRKIIYAIGTVIVLNLIACLIVNFLQCTPLEFLWDPTIPGGFCINQVAFFQYASLPNILTDVAMLVLPIPLVWNLHTDRKTKLGLSLIFLTGSIGIAASIVRFVQYSTIDILDDLTWFSTQMTIWTIMEPGMYLIAACLPIYRPLALKLMGRDPAESHTTKQFRSSGTDNSQGSRVWLRFLKSSAGRSNISSNARSQPSTNIEATTKIEAVYNDSQSTGSGHQPIYPGQQAMYHGQWR